ncbi:MAG: helix-turn-helix transcriptional regulator [Bdellovibrionota bacterium]
MTTKSKAKKFLENLTDGPLTIGGLLWAIREGEELSMAAFAEQLGISRSHLNDIEKGRKPVSPQKAAEYALTLGYSDQQFIRLALQDLLNRNDLDEYEVDLIKRKGA